ncbi:hypothetical protein GuangZ0019_0852 [Mycobacterium tuberculosis GuangZ0019]|nr:hypothetical protein MTBK_18110 [Mycobacterium tuberculosis K]ALA78210.1 Uncharacterized protein BCGR_1893 [Mycobacterium tuberculosis variant bovis BCG]AOZ42924.1 hypothetical protein BTB1458_1923 [Mycobacterium tuberculosis]EQM22877.1 hypothetical protein GuangZ0019_0852 [Mycobacterium tuberculosis GuangZ0019]KAF3403935.1 hypothetical protein BIT18_4133 [Mycobacterium tuberculosis variant bovis]BAQ05752.1 hypothetical protein KURONO_1956 [Mycobacterium tuberculosis str. Kurono]
MQVTHSRTTERAYVHPHRRVTTGPKVVSRIEIDASADLFDE